MGDQLFSIYFDLETTCGKNNYVFTDREDHLVDMYTVSYCLIVYFHQSYSLEKIAVVRSFNDSLEELADLSSVLLELLEFREHITTRQWLDCAKDVAAKKKHHSLIEMFCCELKFLVDISKKFLAEKFKDRLKLTLEAKNKFKEQNSLDIEQLCSICGFDIGAAKKYGTSADKMSYYDFVVKKQFHFLENIFTKEELKSSDTICDLERYYNHLRNFFTSRHNCVFHTAKAIQ